ncbi:MAG: SGNH/GDSL hydrolase family protein [Acidobacteria bacterium]|nr:SGNH/GDSL hydrolase family protein [Acidobacteriota bacterium]
MTHRLPLLLSLLCAISAGACSKDNETPTTPSPTGSPWFYTALGASDAIGFGGSVPCAPFDLNCPNGTGFVQGLLRRLRAERSDTGYENLGVPGAVMSPAVETLAGQIGRPVERNMTDGQAPRLQAATTHLTIFAGGNDANVLGEAVRAGRGGADVRGFVDQQTRQWAEDLATFVGRIRQRAPAARIVVLNLPNLGAAPYMAGNSTQERSIMQRIAVGLADASNALTSRGVLVVDLMCEPRLYSAANFSSDGFHPNDQGYALMAQLAYPALASGTAAPPAATCPQRTLLPVF